MTHSLVATAALAGLLASCAAAGGDDDPMSGSFDSLKISSALRGSDFDAALTKASIRQPQTWLDDAAFEVKWESMLSAPIELLGGASSAFHADLAVLPAKRLPGDEVLCHGDPKIDNFGWTLVDGVAVFSDNDFDDAGFCPVAAEALRYLLATDLAFGDPDLKRCGAGGIRRHRRRQECRDRYRSGDRAELGGRSQQGARQGHQR